MQLHHSWKHIIPCFCIRSFIMITFFLSFLISNNCREAKHLNHILDLKIRQSCPFHSSGMSSVDCKEICRKGEREPNCIWLYIHCAIFNLVNNIDNEKLLTWHSCVPFWQWILCPLLCEIFNNMNKDMIE